MPVSPVGPYEQKQKQKQKQILNGFLFFKIKINLGDLPEIPCTPVIPKCSV